MTRSWLIWCLAPAIVSLIGASPVAAQSSRLESGVSHQATFDFYYETRLSPPVPPLKDFGTAILAMRPDLVGRVLLDRAKRIYFGYSARVEALKDANTYRVTFDALTMTPELQRVLGADSAEWRMLPVPRFPGPQMIRGGDVLELPLLTSNAWGQKVTDYVTVREPRAPGFDNSGPREFASATGAPRDFKVDDAVLRFRSPMVRVVTGVPGSTPSMQNRRVQTDGDLSGSVLWIYVPYRGRFIVSLVPRPGFRRAGEVRGNTLRVRLEAEEIQVISDASIAPGDAAFNLYVLHDAGWKPTYPHANVDTIIVGAADATDYPMNK
jgi:hypothetical protein